MDYGAFTSFCCIPTSEPISFQCIKFQTCDHRRSWLISKGHNTKQRDMNLGSELVENRTR